MTAALELLDRDGVGAFGVRALAKELEVSTSTIYWHVGGREELLAAAVGKMFEELELPSIRDSSWQHVLRSLGSAIRDRMYEHPNLAPVVGSQLVVAAPALGLAEHVVEALEDANVAPSQMATSYNAFMGFIFGWTAVELSVPPVGDGSGVWQREFQHQLAHLSTQDYPALSRHADSLMGWGFVLRWENGVERRHDAAFALAMESILVGIENQVLEAMDRPS